MTTVPTPIPGVQDEDGALTMCVPVRRGYLTASIGVSCPNLDGLATWSRFLKAARLRASEIAHAEREDQRAIDARHDVWRKCGRDFSNRARQCGHGHRGQMTQQGGLG